MKLGTLYGIGIGPGDPELITVKGARLLKTCKHIFAPKARTASDSLALTIARRYIGPAARVYEIVFPMTADAEELQRCWTESARQVAATLKSQLDACFLTLGDPFLYSTYIYLLRALRQQLPDVKIVTVPGVNAFSAAAALAEFPVGEGNDPITIIPAGADLETARSALRRNGTVVLMKIGKRLPKILKLLEAANVLDRSVLVARAGLDGQRIETNLRKLKTEKTEIEYFAVILARTDGEYRV
ncbi:MAG: precorrin-2 C(20)-methyltransferase [Planctomycetota bacterium]